MQVSKLSTMADKSMRPGAGSGTILGVTTASNSPELIHEYRSNSVMMTSPYIYILQHQSCRQPILQPTHQIQHQITSIDISNPFKDNKNQNVHPLHRRVLDSQSKPKRRRRTQSPPRYPSTRPKPRRKTKAILATRSRFPLRPSLPRSRHPRRRRLLRPRLRILLRRRRLP